MSANREVDARFQERQQHRKAGICNFGSGHLVWKIVGGVAIAVAATALIASLPDIKRYIHISRM
jgi:hypothetical protein